MSSAVSRSAVLGGGGELGILSVWAREGSQHIPDGCASQLDTAEVANLNL